VGYTEWKKRMKDRSVLGVILVNVQREEETGNKKEVRNFIKGFKG